MDKDLTSTQEARDLASAAYNAWKIWSHATQEQVDRVCEAMAEAAFFESARLGEMAQKETGFGVAAHKKLKNEFGSRVVWESVRDIKTVGVINHNIDKKYYEIAWPVGVIVALIPSTNPTSTAFYKGIIAVKARNAIVFAPHPSAANCTNEAVHVLAQAAEKAGAPPGLISCVKTISLPGTQELMHHKHAALILATGGTPMVKAAHSTGKPAFGVGPGNVPVYVDCSADIKRAASYIVTSKSFDCSTICATEQAVVADAPIASQLRAEMQNFGAYFTNEAETAALRTTVFNKDGSMNVGVVGKPAGYVAESAGFKVPEGTLILVTPLSKVGKEEPLSHEKLTTVLGWYETDGWEAGCEKCIALIDAGGMGHSLVIHATDEKVIMAFGVEKPVFRVLVNTMGTMGAIGATTGLMPSLTLGPGGIGGAITGDNISVSHLMNIKRLAYEITPPPPEMFSKPEARPQTQIAIPGDLAQEKSNGTISGPELEQLVREVLAEILRN